MIPSNELAVLAAMASEALTLAEAGQVLEGHRLLRAGRERARKALAKGEPWAGDLLNRYRVTLTHFGVRFAVVTGLQEHEASPSLQEALRQFRAADPASLCHTLYGRIGAQGYMASAGGDWVEIKELRPVEGRPPQRRWLDHEPPGIVWDGPPQEY